MKTFAFLMVLFLMVGLQETAFSQEEKPTLTFVYMLERQLTWSQVDSAEKLREVYDVKYKWKEKAIEMGYVLDIRIMITNDVFNYRIEWVYPSWGAMYNPGWSTKVWEAVEPDSEKRKMIDAAYASVFKDAIRRDRIYILKTGAR
jgi:hypothetical protein